ncbi:MAG: hypothetical protein M1305_07450 [Candidatus Marsarchaeota archaeon]|nr:hypothetical protein [Candidatus Marsarchaeota archaeon]
MAGEVYCLHNVILEVEKYMETRRTKNRRLQVRTFSFRYNARIKGKHNILRYDNGHWWVPDEFHRHVFALDSGAELGVDRFTIEEMPTMSEILDELEAMF